MTTIHPEDAAGYTQVSDPTKRNEAVVVAISSAKIAPQSAIPVITANDDDDEEDEDDNEKKSRGYGGIICCCAFLVVVLVIVLAILGSGDSCPKTQKPSALSNSSAAPTPAPVRCQRNIYGRRVSTRSGGSSRSGRSGSRGGRGGGGGGGCFVPGTLVLLANGNDVRIEDLVLGEVLMGGGKVDAVLQIWSEGSELFAIDGVIVDGSHGMKDPEDGQWKRAVDVTAAVPFTGPHSNGTTNPAIIYPVLWNAIVSSHRIFLRTPTGVVLEAADYMEVDETPEMLENSLAYLNSMDENRHFHTSIHPDPQQRGHGWKKTTLTDWFTWPGLPEQRRLKGCFPAETRIELEGGGETIRIDKGAVLLGKNIPGGGRVKGFMRLVGTYEPLYEFELGDREDEADAENQVVRSGEKSADGTGFVVVSGSHTVMGPRDNTWRHAEDVQSSRKRLLADRVEPVLYNLITEHHRIHVVGAPRAGEIIPVGSVQQRLVVADFLESDEEEELLAWNIAQLNHADEL